ncbi:DUF1990 domain-containing protein [soil metagenome]
MFLLTQPDSKTVAKFIADAQTSDLSYEEAGWTSKSEAPLGFNIDHNRIRIGKGQIDFDRSKAAIRKWKMFDIGWVKLFDDHTPIEIGQTVAILVKHFEFYSLNAARIVYVINETRSLQRFGFAYGTLTEHGEIGEERFSVEYDVETDEVWYDLFAFSQPASFLAKVGYPLSRYLQKSFARDSMRAMYEAVSERSIAR